MKPSRIVSFLIWGLPLAAQTGPWTGAVRGSWVQTSAPGAGDVTLTSSNITAQIVVADDENLAVHQAAQFLAGDIEKISGHKPAVVASATPGSATIHLVTAGHAQIPASVNPASLLGQWESYRIVTEGRDVWLV